MTLAKAVLIVITIIWILAVIGGIYRRDWTALNIITPVMLTACGWLYLRKGNGNGKS